MCKINLVSTQGKQEGKERKSVEGGKKGPDEKERKSVFLCFVYLKGDERRGNEGK